MPEYTSHARAQKKRKARRKISFGEHMKDYRLGGQGGLGGPGGLGGLGVQGGHGDQGGLGGPGGPGGGPGGLGGRHLGFHGVKKQKGFLAILKSSSAPSICGVPCRGFEGRQC